MQRDKGYRAGSGVTPLISIVDDDESVRDSIRDLIEAVGLRAEVFGSAQEFLLTFLKASPVSETACLILDVQMPWFTGIELQEWLSEWSRTIPIIFITAHADKEVRQQALAAGAAGFLYKPFSAEALLDSVNAALKRSRN